MHTTSTETTINWTLAGLSLRRLLDGAGFARPRVLVPDIPAEERRRLVSDWRQRR